jgi:hypothetical protein
MKPSRVSCTLDPLSPLKKYRNPCFYTCFTEVLNCFSLKTCIVLQILLHEMYHDMSCVNFMCF